MLLTPVANRKNLKSENFNYFVWTPLGNRVNIYINFAFKFSLRSLQPDIFFPYFATGINDTGGKFEKIRNGSNGIL